VLGAEAFDLIELDVGLLGCGSGVASDPPVGSGEPGREIGPGPGLPALPGAARCGEDYAVAGFPPPDLIICCFEYDGVVPAEDDNRGVRAVSLPFCRRFRYARATEGSVQRAERGGVYCRHCGPRSIPEAVAERIYAERAAGKGLRVIAEGLTTAGFPPSVGAVPGRPRLCSEF